MFDVSGVRGQQCLKLRKTRTGRYLRQHSNISTGHVNHPDNHGCIMNRVPSFSQPDALIPCVSNAYFTTNYVARN